MLHKLSGVSQCQLFFDVRLVGLNGFYAEVEFIGNLPGSVTRPNQPKYF